MNHFFDILSYGRTLATGTATSQNTAGVLLESYVKQPVLSFWLEDLLEINPHAQQSYIINASACILILTFIFSMSFT